MTLKPTSNLLWDHPSPHLVDGYRLYSAGEVAWEGPEMTVQLSDTTLSPGADYTVVIRAYNAIGEADVSNQINFTYVATVPAPATNLRAQV